MNDIIHAFLFHLQLSTKDSIKIAINDINFIKSFKSQKINRPLFEDNKQVSKSGIRINGFCQKWAYSRLNETN